MSVPTVLDRLQALQAQANAIIGQTLMVPGHVVGLSMCGNGALIRVTTRFENGEDCWCLVATQMVSPTAIVEAALRSYIVHHDAAACSEFFGEDAEPYDQAWVCDTEESDEADESCIPSGATIQ